ncbi:Endoglucanase precursor [compost metagenome]
MEYLRADAFGADDQTTRGEFATLLVKGLSLPINADNSQQAFFDVPYGTQTTTWDYEHLETAARAGIITGKIEGFFSPNLPITRQEAAVMIARAAKLKLDTNDDKLAGKLAKSYLDSGRIEYYARPAVQAVSGAKIMSGSPVTLQGAKKASFNFNPTGNMTRAEAGKIAVELFKKNKSTKDMFPKNFN